MFVTMSVARSTAWGGTLKMRIQGFWFVFRMITLTTRVIVITNSSYAQDARTIVYTGSLSCTFKCTIVIMIAILYTKCISVTVIEMFNIW